MVIIMRNFVKKFYDKFTSYKTFEEVTLNGITYRVVEKKNSLSPKKTERALVFKKPESNDMFFHSKIYTDSKKVFQPHGVEFQRFFDCWGKYFQVENALVLGCAGCTIPRFLAFRFPECKILGVEYEEKFVELAKKYFLIDEIKNNFTLIHGDAFAFMEEYDFEEKQDVVLVDVFSENQCPEEVFSKEFIKNLFDKTSANALVVFNLLGKSADEILSFSKSINEKFNPKHVISKGRKTYLLLIKTEDDEKAKAFINAI
jgi:hypothetical protein